MLVSKKKSLQQRCKRRRITHQVYDQNAVDQPDLEVFDLSLQTHPIRFCPSSRRDPRLFADPEAIPVSSSSMCPTPHSSLGPISLHPHHPHPLRVDHRRPTIRRPRRSARKLSSCWRRLWLPHRRRNPWWCRSGRLHRRCRCRCGSNSGSTERRTGGETVHTRRRGEVLAARRRKEGLGAWGSVLERRIALRRAET